MKKLKQCRKGNDFVKLAKKSGAKIARGKGSHVKIRNEKGIAIVPVHNKELGKSLRSALVKTFIGMGIVLFPFICVAINIVAGSAWLK